MINPANDRHGELENETAAIAWLFAKRETHMKRLAADIANQKKLYELPLVFWNGARYVVYDGNRRTTALKLIAEPNKAPTQELKKYFHSLHVQFPIHTNYEVECQVEDDRETIDEILFRRHTGTQKGIGQSTWDERMKSTFIERTGKDDRINVANEIEKALSQASLLPTGRAIPRSILNRLLSAESFRNRVGLSTSKGQFSFTHTPDSVLPVLQKISEDLIEKKISLNDVWDTDSKNSYLDQLEELGLLPQPNQRISPPLGATRDPTQKSSNAPTPPSQSAGQRRHHLIPDADYSIAWPGRLQRHRAIWHELSQDLRLDTHTNAISVLFRVLLELAIENYISQTGLSVHANDNLAARVLKVGKHLLLNKKITDKQLGILNKFQHADKLVSADTLNRYVHSPDFAPSPEHLASMWDSLSFLIVECLRS